MNYNDADFLSCLTLALTPSFSGEDMLEYSQSGLTPDEFISGIRKYAGMTKDVRDNVRRKAIEEAEFIAKHNVKALFITDKEYPSLLRRCHEAPPVIFITGNCPSSFSHSLSVVGTRHATQYGLRECVNILQQLAANIPDLWVISGLAYGVDACAHNAALELHLPTLAVVAHGLDTIYPAPHRNLARGIIDSGGAIITQYPSQTPPFRSSFLQRNKIIAGISDATFVIESDMKGGAMSTARSAYDYGRPVLVLPGRTTDRYSSGCLKLVTHGLAHIVTSAADIIDILEWKPVGKDKAVQHSLFPELTTLQQDILDAIQNVGREISIDEINALTGTSIPQLLTTLFELEMLGIITKFPGDRYGVGR